MKKVLLGLTTLLLISCVNLDEPKVQKVVNSPKSSNKNNVVKTQKEEKKKLYLLLIKLRLLKPEIY